MLPGFFACIIGADVLDKVSIPDLSGSISCVQQDTIMVDDVIWCGVGCGLCNGESYL